MKIITRQILLLSLVPLFFLSCAGMKFVPGSDTAPAEPMAARGGIEEKSPVKTVSPAADDLLQLQSGSFEDYGFLDLRHSLEKENISPDLHWKGIPAGAKSLAVIVYNFTPEAQKWLHWGIYNIPVSVRNIPEGASLSRQMPRGAEETLNSYDYILEDGSRGWAGPSLPRGDGTHEYRFLLLALNRTALEIAPRDCVDAESLYYALEPWILAETFITGLFKAP